jgi:hypothetical protein
MLPLFPNFKSLELGDKKFIDDFNAAFDPYSDFNFCSLWAWDTASNMKISLLNGNIVIRFVDYVSREPFFSFFGLSNVNETALELLSFAKSEGVQMELHLIPEVTAQAVDSVQLTAIENQDHFDYIYIVSDLVTYSGKIYATKRNLVNRFVAKHPDVSARRIDPREKAIQKEMIHVIREWEKHKKNKNADLELVHEMTALERFLLLAEQYQLLGVGIYIGEQLIGFNITEIVSSQYALSHFAKTDYRSAGTYDYLMKETARVLHQSSILYLNYEQDLGIPTLRHSKLSYRPFRYLKKFTIKRS